MATRLSLEAPTIQVNAPDTDLSIDLNSEELRPDKIFTIHSVDSSPLDMKNAFQAPTSPLLDQNTKQDNTVHRNSLDFHRNSLTNRRSSKEQEEVNRNKRHRGKIYRTLTLEESAYHEDYVFCSSSDVDTTQEFNNKNSDEENVFSARKIETKRHTYVYMHYVEQVSLLITILFSWHLTMIQFSTVLLRISAGAFVSPGL